VAPLGTVDFRTVDGLRFNSDSVRNDWCIALITDRGSYSLGPRIVNTELRKEKGTPIERAWYLQVRNEEVY